MFRRRSFLRWVKHEALYLSLRRQLSAGIRSGRAPNGQVVEHFSCSTRPSMRIQDKPMRRNLFLIIVLLLVSTPTCPGWAQDLSSNDRDPRAPGPFPVGVTTTVFVDSSRTDAFTKEPRTLVTEIWYPATQDARQSPKNKYTDFLPGGVTPEVDAVVQKTYKLPAAELDKLFWDSAVRDARVAAGKFPLIIFSHGNGGNRHQNTFWCDYLASYGYVIASADHTGNANMTIIKGKPIPYQGSQRTASAIDRPKDMSFLFDQMTLWNEGADS